MKQNKDGKKIQNWHKPLHQGAFKNRFLRRWHVDPELQLPKETALPSGQLNRIRAEEVDACWNYRDPHGFGWGDENSFEGNYSHFLWAIFNEVNRPPNNPFGPLLADLEPTVATDGDLDDGISHTLTFRLSIVFEVFWK